MKRDTTHNVGEGLRALKKRSPIEPVPLKVAGDTLIAEGPPPRREDGIFVAKMERLGWTWDGKAWVHELDGVKPRGRPKASKDRQVKAAPKDRSGGE